MEIVQNLWGASQRVDREQTPGVLGDQRLSRLLLPHTPSLLGPKKLIPHNGTWIPKEGTATSESLGDQAAIRSQATFHPLRTCCAPTMCQKVMVLGSALQTGQQDRCGSVLMKLPGQWGRHANKLITK